MELILYGNVIVVQFRRELFLPEVDGDVTLDLSDVPRLRLNLKTAENK